MYKFTCRIKLIFVLLLLTRLTFSQPVKPVQVTLLYHDSVRLVRYARSIQDLNGDIYVQGGIKVALDKKGDAVVSTLEKDYFPKPAVDDGAIHNFYFSRNFYLALGYRVNQDSGTMFSTILWRSSQGIPDMAPGVAGINLPQAGRVDYGKKGEWAGLFCHRGLLRLPDGSFLACVYGNFESDTLVPTNPQSKLETKFKLRAFVIKSTDEGRNWNYLASLAVPRADHPDNSEGFNEWNMVQLNDGRIMAVIRTGHFTPPVLSFSRDQGLTWSVPVVHPAFQPAACDPYLLKLSDGRIALSYGEMIQPAASEQDFKDFKAGDHSRKCRLAISTTPGADNWTTFDITTYGNRSAYSNIFEIKPGVLIYQTGMDIYQVQLQK